LPPNKRAPSRPLVSDRSQTHSGRAPTSTCSPSRTGPLAPRSGPRSQPLPPSSRRILSFQSKLTRTSSLCMANFACLRGQRWSSQRVSGPATVRHEPSGAPPRPPTEGVQNVAYAQSWKETSVLLGFSHQMFARSLPLPREMPPAGAQARRVRARRSNGQPHSPLQSPRSLRS
jgi:hypothetical protein